MARSHIYVDFMNADSQGRVRMNCVGTTEDLEKLGLRLEDGLRVIVHDDELEADGEVQFSADEKLWVARIDWNALRPLAATAASHA